MSKQIDVNLLFDGQTGKIGPFVIKNVGGELQISKRPKRRPEGYEYTEEHIERMNKFGLAAKWASAHKDDKEFIEAAKNLKKPYISAYNLALKAAILNPEIMVD